MFVNAYGRYGRYGRTGREGTAWKRAAPFSFSDFPPCASRRAGESARYGEGKRRRISAKIQDGVRPRAACVPRVPFPPRSVPLDSAPLCPSVMPASVPSAHRRVRGAYGIPLRDTRRHSPYHALSRVRAFWRVFGAVAHTRIIRRNVWQSNTRKKSLVFF